MSSKSLLITDRSAIRAAFGKSEKDVSTDIGIIKEWSTAQPHLPEIPSDQMIESFLVNTKFSIERTKQKIDMFYTIRSIVPEIYNFTNPQSPEMRNITDMGVFVPLPKLTKELFRVNVMKIVGPPEDYDNYKFFAHCISIMEIRTSEDLSLGDIYIIDQQNLKMGHVAKTTPVHIKKAYSIAEKVFSVRIKGVHLINAPSYTEILVNIGKAVLSPKIFGRIHLHNNLEELYDFVPKEVLPKDYGGEELSVQELTDLWKINLKEHSDRFNQLEQMKVKEELRPTPLKNDDLLGYHGNFKKLDVD